jgi:hypothetical protein
MLRSLNYLVFLIYVFWIVFDSWEYFFSEW